MGSVLQANQVQRQQRSMRARGRATAGATRKGSAQAGYPATTRRSGADGGHGTSCCYCCCCGPAQDGLVVVHAALGLAGVGLAVLDASLQGRTLEQGAGGLAPWDGGRAGKRPLPQLRRLRPKLRRLHLAALGCTSSLCCGSAVCKKCARLMRCPSYAAAMYPCSGSIRGRWAVPHRAGRGCWRGVLFQRLPRLYKKLPTVLLLLVNHAGRSAADFWRPHWMHNSRPQGGPCWRRTPWRARQQQTAPPRCPKQRRCTAGVGRAAAVRELRGRRGGRALAHSGAELARGTVASQRHRVRDPWTVTAAAVAPDPAGESPETRHSPPGPPSQVSWASLMAASMSSFLGALMRTTRRAAREGRAAARATAGRVTLTRTLQACIVAGDAGRGIEWRDDAIVGHLAGEHQDRRPRPTQPSCPCFNLASKAALQSHKSRLRPSLPFPATSLDHLQRPAPSPLAALPRVQQQLQQQCSAQLAPWAREQQ